MIFLPPYDGSLCFHTSPWGGGGGGARTGLPGDGYPSELFDEHHKCCQNLHYV